MTPVLTTDRLVLRGWRDEDLDALAALDADPEVMRYIGDGSTRTREQTVRTLERLAWMWDHQGFGLFAVDWRGDLPDEAAEAAARLGLGEEAARFAGWVGLSVPKFLPEILPAVEIGWRLGRHWWGRGIATEAATEVLRFGFGDLALDHVVSICDARNAGSERVMTKLG